MKKITEKHTKRTKHIKFFLAEFILKKLILIKARLLRNNTTAKCSFT